MKHRRALSLRTTSALAAVMLVGACQQGPGEQGNGDGDGDGDDDGDSRLAEFLDQDIGAATAIAFVNSGCPLAGGFVEEAVSLIFETSGRTDNSFDSPTARP